MAGYQQITRELQALERVHAELHAIAGRSDERRRHDLVELRRRFSQQLADVGRLAEPLFAAMADRSLEQDYRRHFSRIRSEAAAHQAKWPAIKVDEASELYRRSAIAVGEAHRDFVGWMRDTLGRLERSL
jgi:hypothetical protein